VPYVTDLMGLVGAVLTMSISLMLPALFQLKLGGRQLPPGDVARALGVLCLGAACATVGATSAVGSLKAKLAAAAAAGL
jgi:hypothetical protein